MQIIKNSGSGNSTELTDHIENTSNPHSVTKTQVGLGNVTDAAQVEKSILTAAGQIIASSASATPVVIPAPTQDGDVLTASLSSEGKIAWVTPLSDTPVALTDAATIEINLALSKSYYVTLGGNRVISITNPREGGRYKLTFTQDSTGGRSISSWTVYNPQGSVTSIKWSGQSPPSLSTSPSVSDVIVLTYENGYYYGQYDYNYA